MTPLVKRRSARPAAAATSRLALAALALAACGTPYIYGPTAPTAAPPKPADCAFVLLEAAPSRPFEELGVIAPEDIRFGSVPDSEIRFRHAVGETVCRAGGDAVVVERSRGGSYVRGTVIRYR